ncbi:hypothetical protein BD289DRAFT_76158 [Coniella lustricola]|uniref:Uncharacterized protein n=1 Tax=Coniella lustricola TaxID=2025994 RepID=A0A2T2ZZL1_9PEZI|nr:hypothetical protein BD289DRAFT_76158 [Coniella lustricola]
MQFPVHDSRFTVQDARLTIGNAEEKDVMQVSAIETDWLARCRMLQNELEPSTDRDLSIADDKLPTMQATLTDLSESVSLSVCVPVTRSYVYCQTCQFIQFSLEQGVEQEQRLLRESSSTVWSPLLLVETVFDSGSSMAVLLRRPAPTEGYALKLAPSTPTQATVPVAPRPSVASGIPGLARALQ